jgi:DNA-directed RNA polymerase specialized sigma24 family protein
MSQQDDEMNDEFDVVFFIRSLERLAAYRLQARGCVKSNECAHDVVSDVLPRHSEYTDDKDTCNRIRLNHPAANNKRAYLYSSLRFALLNKKRDCKDCKPGMVPIVEEPEPEGHSPSRSSPGPIEPQTPETLFSEVELIERVLSRIKNTQRRAVLEARVLYDLSYEEIAAELGVKESLARKWVQRDIQFLKKEFPTIESLWRDRPDVGPGLDGLLT